MDFLIDLDKTLIDGSMRVTDSRIRSVITGVQSRGHNVGLSSDTSLVSLLDWYREFGMNGSILAERGAHLMLPQREVLSTNSSDQQFFSSLRERFVVSFSEKFSVDLLLCDPSFLIRTKRYRADVPHILGFVNRYRRYSFHVAFREILPNGDYCVNANISIFLERSLDIFKEICLTLQKDLNLFDIDLNFEAGLLIIHDARTVKRFGTLTLLRESNLPELVVIGDGVNDFTGIAQVSHWAVGNANESYKEKCTRVATRNYTEGVIELLESVF